MTTSTWKNALGWLCAILLFLGFGMAGLPKLLGAAVWMQKFAHWGYSPWFVYAIGAIELAGAVLVLFPKRRGWAD
ncbi:MAG: DoxX family protein [Gammaproteobacteria bacterium]|nr:DoxX family protein [Gammaproteobacteria bacterium]